MLRALSAPLGVSVHARALPTRLTRTHHAPNRRALLRAGTRCRAEGGAAPRHGSAEEAELQNLMVRLREDDVEYFDLKKMCRERGLGGKDSKYNLRAKLLRWVRAQLGFPVYGPDNVAPATVRAPDQLTEEELRHIFDLRGCLMPPDSLQAVSMANALLIADGLLNADQVSWPTLPVEYETLTVAQLRDECQVRSLATKGLKQDLIDRLRQWDADTAKEAEQHSRHEQAAAEAAAAEGVSPTATNLVQLHAAQDLYAQLQSMEVTALREQLAARGEKTQGTKQILVAKLSKALERDVAHALGGKARLAQWAETAVGHMDEDKVEAELQARGAAYPQGSLDEARATLQAQMQLDWVTEALHGGLAERSAGAEASDSEGAANGAGGYDSSEDAAASAAAIAEERALLGGRLGDPTLALALLCGGHTALARNASLAAARLAAHCLQSDRHHGLRPAAQLEAGAGAERQGVAVAVVYEGPSGAALPLTWEQLHAASAAELDARLALGGAAADAAAAQQTAAAADVVLPLGLSPGSATLAAAAGAKAACAVSEASAALAADRHGFAARAAELGFAAVPATRLHLADFADAAGASQLSDLKAYRELQAWAERHLLPGAAPRLAVRAEAAGSVLGGALASGVPAALQAALALAHEHGVSELVVEAVVPGAVHVTCSVLQGPGGAVALPPTELTYWDVEDEIGEADLQFERHLAAREGLDMDGVDALLELLLQEQRAHPGYLGGLIRPSQQLRQHTPPQGLSTEGSQAVRQASVRLFQLLGLRDYAQFTCWVLPPPPAAEAQQSWQQRQQAAAEAAAAAEAEQQRPRSFAELLEVDAAVRAQQQEVAASAVSSADRAAALDTTAAPAAAGNANIPPSPLLAAELAEAAGELAAEHAPIRYGSYNGLEIDDSVRVTGEQAAEELAPYQRPIPQPPVYPTVEALEDLSSADPAALCRLPSSGQAVAFATLSLVPDLSGPASVLRQQAAAVGMSAEALLRHLVSAALVRGGAEPLPPLPEAVAAAEEAAAEEAAAEAEAAAVAAGEQRWGMFASMVPLQEDKVAELLASRTAALQEALAAGGDEPPPLLHGSLAVAAAEFSTWAPAEELEQQAQQQQAQQQAQQQQQAAEEGGEGGPFQFVDATGDPSLDPVFQQQQQQQQDAASWQQWQQEAAGLPPSYDEIAAGGGSDYLAEVAANMALEDPADAQAEAGAAGGPNPEHMHPTKQRVWVLLGGEGPDRSQSLAAGLHVYTSLRQHPEYLVEGYLLEHNYAGSDEEARRRRLLERRRELLELGLDDAWLLQEQPLLDLQRIRHPPGSEGSPDLDSQCLWRLSDSGLVRGEVEDLQVACQAALATANAPLEALEDAGGDLAGAQLSVARQELELAGLQLDGSAWGGASARKLQPAQYMWLRDFARQAQDVGALVFLALGSQPAALGPLQRLLDEHGVPYTGSGAGAAEACADKALLMEQLLDLEEVNGVSTAPQHQISLPELAAACEGGADGVARLYDQLCASLGGAGGVLAIKPAYAAAGATGGGVMRLSSAAELALYTRALSSWASVIPGELLGPGAADVAMPVPPPSQFVVEPWVTAEPVTLVRGADGALVPPPAGAQTHPGAAPDDALASALHWPAANQWLRVDAVVLGGTGHMRCLPPAVRVVQLQQDAAPPPPGSAAAAAAAFERLALEAEAAEVEDEEEAAALRARAADVAAAAAAAASGEAAAPRATGSFLLAPPPPTLASPHAVQSARVRFEIVADRLALSGAAEISAYMHAETGELVVADVSATPDLSPGSLAYRAAAADAEAPLSSAELLHELVRVGLMERPDDAGRGADDMAVMAPYPEAGEDASAYDYTAESEFSSWKDPGFAYQEPALGEWSGSTQ